MRFVAAALFAIFGALILLKVNLGLGLGPVIDSALSADIAVDVEPAVTLFHESGCAHAAARQSRRRFESER